MLVEVPCGIVNVQFSLFVQFIVQFICVKKNAILILQMGKLCNNGPVFARLKKSKLVRSFNIAFVERYIEVALQLSMTSSSECAPVSRSKTLCSLKLG